MSSQQTDAEIRRLAQLLEAVLRYEGGSSEGLRVGARAIERKLGWSAGTLSRVLKGRIEFKFRHLFDVLEALGFSPKDFFELAYQQPERTLSSQEILRYLKSRDSRGALNLAVLTKDEGSVSDEELDRRIIQALRRISLQAGEPESDS
jgi:transcriptional regulator with XRE-family HTH domain